MTENYTLTRKPDKVLCKYWWSESPFDKSIELKIPIYSLNE